jgi:hypothetical protein
MIRQIAKKQRASFTSERLADIGMLIEHKRKLHVITAAYDQYGIAKLSTSGSTLKTFQYLVDNFST